MITPPTANPTIASVNGNEASARGTANSACTAGSATTTDHIPTPPMVGDKHGRGKTQPRLSRIGQRSFARGFAASVSTGRHSLT